jgi:phosphate transport system permease protein
MAALAIAIAPLVAIMLTAIVRGGRAFITPSFYVDTPPPPCSPTECALGGIGPAIQGTLILVGLASLIAIPLGILAGIYLSEYGRKRLGPFTSAVVNALTGLPSILIGLVIFVIFIAYAPNLTFSTITGALALAILMLPIVVRATEEALKQVPQGLREAALALGFPRHRVALRVVLGTARTTVIVGVILAVARAGGETAALLLTAGGSTLYFQGLDRPVAALTLFIFNYGQSSYSNWVEAAWGAALVLVVLMLAISVAARITLRRSAGTAEAG